ncbi:MAG: NAD(P)-dependent oxidoreductase, partial [Candidatus Bilamarchaeaceae archaeon]
MQKISVIGGSGFIGTRLCKRLKGSNGDFFIIDKKVSQTFPEETTVVDVREIEGLRKAIKGDVIVNFAAEHRDDVRPKSLYWEVNVKGAENVCKVAEEKGIDKIIFTSSVAVYGFTEKETFEDGELRPFNDYGITKLEAEKVYINWQKKDPNRRTLVIIRPTVVFGEGNRGNVYNLLKQIASGRFIMVGNGKNIKSMAYVENVAAF